MIKVILFSVFYLQAFSSNCQTKDTVRIYNYENGYFGFKLTTKNNREFSFIQCHSADTLSGKLIKQNSIFRLATGTTHLNEWKRKDFAGISKSIWLEWHPLSKTPLLYISFDTSQRLNLDISNLSNALIGNYLVTTGHVGCRLELKEKTVTFFPFNDAGGDEGHETVSWIKNNKGITLKGKSYLDKWFTDSKQFYYLPYFIVGQKTQQTKKVYTQTYTYFIKTKELN